MRRTFRWLGVTLAVLVVATQLVPYGRDHVNPTVTQEPRWDRGQREAHESAKTVIKGEMPPWFYLAPRPHARLTASERAALIAGLEATFGGERRARDDRRKDDD